jgi:hypothetical protein
MSSTPHAPVHFPEEWTDPTDYDPFDEVEILPGLGIAVLWVVLSYVFVNQLLLAVHAVRGERPIYIHIAGSLQSRFTRLDIGLAGVHWGGGTTNQSNQAGTRHGQRHVPDRQERPNGKGAFCCPYRNLEPGARIRVIPVDNSDQI